MTKDGGRTKPNEAGGAGTGEGLLAGGFHECGERFEERVAGVVQQRVEDRFDGQHMNAGVAKGGDAGGGIGGTAGTDGIHEDSHLQTEAQRAECGLINANGSLEAAKEQVFDLGGVQMGGDGLMGKGRESILGKHGGERGEFAQAWIGGAEFGRNLFAENDRDAEAVRGGEGKAGASSNGGGIDGGKRADKGGLQIHGEQGSAGGCGLGGGRDGGARGEVGGGT